MKYAQVHLHNKASKMHHALTVQVGRLGPGCLSCFGVSTVPERMAGWPLCLRADSAFRNAVTIRFIPTELSPDKLVNDIAYTWCGWPLPLVLRCSTCRYNTCPTMHMHSCARASYHRIVGLWAGYGSLLSSREGCGYDCTWTPERKNGRCGRPAARHVRPRTDVVYVNTTLDRP